jgi:hypothetical protein
MLDGSYPPHRTQEHRPSTHRSAGTSERAAASRVPARHTTRGIIKRGTLQDRASGPESPTAQDSPAEEQQPEDYGTEYKTNEEHPPLSDTEPEKMYRDADEVESFGAESPILAGRLRALLEHLGITTAPRYRVKEVPRLGRVELRPSQSFSSDPGSSVDTRDQPSGLHAAMLLLMPPGRPSHHGSVATRADCRTLSTTSFLIGRRINSRPTG